MFIAIEKVLNEQALQKVREIVLNAKYVDGKLTAGAEAVRVKNNLQVASNTEESAVAGNLILQSLGQHVIFRNAARPKLIMPPLFSCYEPGMSYGNHLDDPAMGKAPRIRTDISMTIHLNDASEYEGGELAVEDDGVTRKYKYNAGDAILYPSSYIHRVEPVTRGKRYVAVTWIQSVIRDKDQRRILYDVTMATNALAEERPDRPEVQNLRRVIYNLVRMWGDF